jgi:hypothetical protein
MSEDCFVYVIAHAERSPGRSPVKVGISSDPLARFRTLQTASPYRLCLYGTWRLPKRKLALQIEATFHRDNKKYRLSGEWFATYEFGACLEIDYHCINLAIDMGHDLAGVYHMAEFMGISRENADEVLFNSCVAYDRGLAEVDP